MRTPARYDFRPEALPPDQTICGACGQPWNGRGCGQAENGWEHPVCYPVPARAPGPTWPDVALALGALVVAVTGTVAAFALTLWR